MNKKITNWLIVLLLCFVHAPYTHAETDSDISVSDCIGKGKDCDSKNSVDDDSKTTTKMIDAPVAEKSVGLSTGDYIRTLFAFIFVIGLLVWLLRFLNKRNRKFDQNRLMTNLGGVPLGQHKSIQLVKMGNHYFVVGVGENVQLLREIEDPAEIEDLLARYEREDSEVRKGILAQLYERFFSKSTTTPNAEGSSDFNTLFSTKIAEIKADRKQEIDRLNGKGSDRND